MQPSVFDALPPLQGQTVLDLGCGVGDQAAELVARGARVIGVDMDAELLREAQAKRLPNAEFRTDDLRTPADFGVAADSQARRCGRSRIRNSRSLARPARMWPTLGDPGSTA